MKRTLLLLIIINLTFSCTQLLGQTDSTYTYTFSCQNCGTYETVSFVPIDLQTQASVTDLILPDSANVSLAQFASTASRKSNPVINKVINRFNIYPNPIKDVFYLYIETTNSDIMNLQLIDIYGRKISEKKEAINEGVNILEEKIQGLAEGIYFIKLNFNKQTFTRKIHIRRN